VTARGLGWRPDHTHPELGAAQLPHKAAAIPEAVSLHGLCDVIDQAQASSCPANAYAGAMLLWMRAHGMSDAKRPSDRWLYKHARELDEHEGRGGLATDDDGTFSSSIAKVINTVGWPIDASWPWDPATVNEGIPDRVRREAHDQIHGVERYALWAPTREDVQEAFCANNGSPILTAMYVDSAFMDCRDFKPLSLDGRAVGGHMVFICGYDRDGVIICNSHGIRFGVGGFCRVSWEALPRLLETTAIRGVRRATS